MDGSSEFVQPTGFINTRGLETNIKLTYNNFKLFIGYTLADVNQHYNGIVSKYPLVARHRLNNVLMYEIEDKLKIGLEAYYTGPQLLNDGANGKSYWITGLMIEKLWETFSLFINFEKIFMRPWRDSLLMEGLSLNFKFNQKRMPEEINGISQSFTFCLTAGRSKVLSRY